MAQKISMAGGDGEHAYSKNSTVQGRIMATVVFPVLNKALQQVVMPESSKPIVIADLGCSTGPNSITMVSHIVHALRSRCPDAGKGSPTLREFQVYFNDLPWNDFNTLFSRLCENEADRSNFFVAGVPGSFISRVFPSSSVHVFASTMALHYLSKIPSSLTDERSPAFNRGHLWVHGATDATAQAYKEQFYMDWNSLLRARSEELVPGGLLCFVIKTRPSPKANALDAKEEAGNALWMCLQETADEALAKGIITEQQLNALNVPMYFPLFQQELLEIVKGFDSEFEIVAAEEIRFPPMLQSSSSPESETFNTGVEKIATALIRGILGGDIFRQVMGEEQHEIFWQIFSQVVKKYTSALANDSSHGCIAMIKK